MLLLSFFRIFEVKTTPPIVTQEAASPTIRATDPVGNGVDSVPVTPCNSSSLYCVVTVLNSFVIYVEVTCCFLLGALFTVSISSPAACLTLAEPLKTGVIKVFSILSVRRFVAASFIE